MKHLIDPTDFTKEEIDEIIEYGEYIIANRELFRDKLRYHKLATLFYEPSTRTRLS
ncbi:MAG: aspartate carbamoyltransferase, partial [Bacteroidales bacterium]|nr:aspartate carbamoyltransferase [Bacteroidales bacterium]